MTYTLLKLFGLLISFYSLSLGLLSLRLSALVTFMNPLNTRGSPSVQALLSHSTTGVIFRCELLLHGFS